MMNKKMIVKKAAICVMAAVMSVSAGGGVAFAAVKDNGVAETANKTQGDIAKSDSDQSSIRKEQEQSSIDVKASAANTPAPMAQTGNEKKENVKVIKKANENQHLTDYQGKCAAVQKAKSDLLSAMKKAGLKVDGFTNNSKLDITEVEDEISDVRDQKVKDSLTKLLNSYKSAAQAEACAKAALESAGK